MNEISGLKMPPFTSDPDCIPLSDIKMAAQAVNTLHQIGEPPPPPYLDFAATIQSYSLAAVILVGNLIKFIAFHFFNTILDFPIITACKITIVKPKPETNKGESAPL